MGREVDRVSPTRDPLATAVLMLLVGLILVIMGAGAIQIVVVFAGVMMIVYGSSHISRGIRGNASTDLVIGILLAIVGLLLVVATGSMTRILIIVVGLFLMVLGILAIVGNLDSGGRRRTVALVVGIVMVVLGVLLVAYPGATTDTFIRILGVVMAVAASLSVYTYAR